MAPWQETVQSSSNGSETTSLPYKALYGTLPHACFTACVLQAVLPPA